MLPLPDASHATGTLEKRHRPIQLSGAFTDLRRENGHRLSGMSAHRFVELLPQRGDLRRRSPATRCRSYPRTALRFRLLAAWRAERPGDRCRCCHLARRNVLAYQPLDLFFQICDVSCHAPEIARPDPGLNPTPERLRLNAHRLPRA